MKFRIDQKIFEEFTGLNVGVIVAKGINNGSNTKEIEDLTRAEEERIRANFISEQLSQIPEIGTWRKAYSSFGGKPKENKSSVENLYRRILKGESLRHINSLVDIYNYISLKYMLPVGGEDIDKIKGNVVLTFATEAEPPALLLGDKEPRAPHAGEVIYKDDISAICRRWNWREADRTKLTDETKNCILVVEGLPPIDREKIEASTGELKDLIQEYCGGKLELFTLSKDNREVDI